jgi:antitoxin component of MazEF toxin-antitoxin module
MEAKVVRIGNSQGVRIPKAALLQTRLSAGQRVRLEVVEDTIVIRPAARPSRVEARSTGSRSTRPSGGKSVGGFEPRGLDTP